MEAIPNGRGIHGTKNRGRLHFPFRMRVGPTRSRNISAPHRIERADGIGLDLIQNRRNKSEHGERGDAANRLTASSFDGTTTYKRAVCSKYVGLKEGGA